MKITSVTVPSRWIDADGLEKNAHAEFTLGVGPCGKTVRELRVEFLASGGVRVAQYCTDGSTQDFFYPAALLTGRIKVESEPDAS